MKYNVRWVHPVTLVCVANVDIIASSDEIVIKEADRLTISLQVTKCPRTIYEKNYANNAGGRRLVDRPGAGFDRP